MAAIKSNIVGTVVSLLFVSAAAYAGWNVFTEPSAYVAESAPEQKISTAYGIDGDGTSDTIRALRATVEAQRAEMDKLMEQNKESMAESRRLVEVLSNNDSRAAEAIEKAMAERESTADKRTSQLEETIFALKNGMEKFTRDAADERKQGAAEQTEVVPPGFGLGGSAIGQYDPVIDAVWVTPSAGPTSFVEQGKEGFKPLGATASAAYTGVAQRAADVGTGRPVGRSSSSTGSGSADRTLEKKPEKERFYTIPDLSALSGGVAATSLVGRVYDDEIKDPYPFKISIGRENFAASFIELPDEIVGMLYEGYAVGDWTMSCVRGDLVAASFIFDDGTVVKAYGDSEGSRPDTAQLHQNTIGYITDAYGNPCVEGTRHTSAPQSLLARMFAAGVEGYGAALSDAEITRENDSGVVTELVTGEVDKYAGAKALQEGASETAQWLRQRAARLIDVIYAPAGVTVSVHLQQEIHIDKNPNARKVRYKNGVKRHANLD